MLRILSITWSAPVLQVILCSAVVIRLQVKWRCRPSFANKRCSGLYLCRQCIFLDTMVMLWQVLVTVGILWHARFCCILIIYIHVNHLFSLRKIHLFLFNNRTFKIPALSVFLWKNGKKISHEMHWINCMHWSVNKSVNPNNLKNKKKILSGIDILAKTCAMKCTKKPSHRNSINWLFCEPWADDLTTWMNMFHTDSLLIEISTLLSLDGELTFEFCRIEWPRILFDDKPTFNKSKTKPR